MITGNISGWVTNVAEKEVEKVVEVNPKLTNKLKSLGALDFMACFSCGTCTVTCPLSVSGTEFPRKIIRYGILGMEKELLSMPQPWLCYYCGDCTRECPRDANPASFMMAARRFSIIKYSIGGVAALFYSKISAIISLLLISLLASYGLLYFSGIFDLNTLFTLSNTFNPYTLTEYNFIHEAGLTLGAFVGIVALIQALKMYSYLRRSSSTTTTEKSIPLGSKIKFFLQSLVSTVIKEGALELRYLKCEKKGRYLAHMAIAWGMILLFTASGLNYIRDSYLLGTYVSSLIGHLLPVVIGITSGVITCGGCLYFVVNRGKKTDEYFEYTHVSDAVFLILLLLSVLTGFLIDIFNYASIAYYAYAFYFAHLVFVFDLIVTAPFTKFAHWGYRLIAVWFNEYNSLVSSVKS